jgi:hypothetical protein
MNFKEYIRDIIKEELKQNIPATIVVNGKKRSTKNSNNKLYIC